jgi:hypothetical protein
MQLQLPLIYEILAPDDIGIKKKKKKLLMTLPVMISSFVYFDNWLSFSVHTCL